MSIPRDALKLVQERLQNFHGFLGAALATRYIVVSWLEYSPLPSLPAAVKGVPILVRICPSSVAMQTTFKVSGSWLDTWKRAGADAWDEYTATLKSFWS